MLLLSLSEVSSPILVGSACVALGGYMALNRIRTMPTLMVTSVVTGVAITIFSGTLGSHQLASQLIESEEAKIAQFKKNLPVLIVINMCLLSALAVAIFRR